MRTRIGGFTVVSIAAGSAACVWIYWVHGLLVAAAVASGAASVGLAVTLYRERRRTTDLENALAEQTARARMVSDHAWRSELLAQILDELPANPDEDSALPPVTSALARALAASRVVLYGRRGAGDGFQVRAQFVADGVSPRDVDAVLPAVLASDRTLAERLLEGERAMDASPELRAVRERLQVSSSVVVPIGEHHVLTLDRVGKARSWTKLERRLIHRFAGELAGRLARAEEWRAQMLRAQTRTSLLRVAIAACGARQSCDVAEIATNVGAPLARARGSAVLVDRADRGFTIAAQSGFDPVLSTASVSSLESELDDSLRARSPVRIGERAIVVRDRALRAYGALLAVPLYAGREPLGVLLLEKDPTGDTWHGDDVEIAESLAHLTASALKNARRFEALDAAEARTTELYDASLDLHQTIDSRGRILECNLTHHRLLGYTKENLLGSRFENLLSPESVSPWRRFSSTLFDGAQLREGDRDVSLRLRARDGHRVDVRLTASNVAASEARPRSARIVMRDVTELRSLEDQLRQSQKLEAVGALAGGIAHDFNNVLGGILGYASLLQARLEERSHVRRYVETIERSAVRGGELTGRLLATLRQSPTQREPVPVNQVVEETLELLDHTIDKKVRIEKRLDPRVRSLLADEGQLQQIVLNLCVNARDAMHDGGLLRVETEVRDRGERLRLSVEDTGEGMEPATMERLFEPFYSTKGEGRSGLGLSVVYGIVKSMNGDVRVKSSPGQGARFDIFIPATWVDERDRSDHLAEPTRGSGELVLLVDDERVLRDLAKEILESYGYRVEAVESGEDALSFLRYGHECVALVILDLVMPGLDGRETYRRLRELDADVPVLLSSGLSAEDSVEEILAAGATGFIPKPYGMGELTRAVKLAIGGDAPFVH